MIKLEKLSNLSDWVIVLIFVIANIILKTLFIDMHSYWLDEATQVFMSQKSLVEIYKESLIYPNGPVYTSLLAFWEKIFGISEFSTRFLSVLFSAFTVPVIYFFVKKYFNQVIAVASVIIFSLSDWQTYYAHEARSYTLVSLLVVASFYMFYNLLFDYKRKYLIYYTIINILLFYTHLTPILIIPIQGLISLYFIKKEYKKIFLIWGSMIFSLAILSIWFLNNNWFGGGETVWLKPPNFTTLRNMFYAYFNYYIIFYIFFVLLLAYSIISILKKDFNVKFWGILLWGILPIIIIYFSSIYYNPRFIHRYMLYATPGLYIAFSFLFFNVLKNKIFSYSLFTLVVILMTINLRLTFKENGQWREALQYYKEHKKPNSATILSANYLHVPFSYYFDKEIFKDYNNIKNRLLKDTVFLTNSEDVFNKYNFEQYDYLYMVLAHYEIVDPDSSMYKYALKKYKLIDVKDDLRKVKVLTFDLNSKYVFDTLKYSFEEYDKLPFADSSKTSRIAYVDKDLEYSKTFIRDLSLITKKYAHLLSIQAQVKYYSPEKEVLFVVSIETKDGKHNYLWKGIDLRKTGEAAKWNNISVDISLPKVEKGSIIKIYLWNKSKAKAEFKNIRIVY